MNGYLIEKYSNMEGAYSCRRLIEEAKKQGIDLRLIGIYDCYMEKDGIYCKKERLEQRDFVINRYKWGKLKEELNLLARRTYNPIEAYNIYINKYEQVRRLSLSSVKIPDYVMGNASIPYQILAEKLKVPFVAKGLESSMGQEILLISKEAEYLALLSKYGIEKEWLFEQFIQNSFGRDMRFYSIRGEVTAAMERRSASDFRANVALGGSVRSIDITDFMRKTAKEVYEQTGLDFLGIDLLYGTEGAYFCEINVMPGLEGIEKASKVNVAGEIIRTIRNDF